MTQTIAIAKRLGMTSALAAFVAMAAPAAPALAQMKGKTATTYKSTIGGRGKARFDWFANKGSSTERPRTVAANTSPPGNGSWICSPAGFGKQSRCYRR